VIKAKRARAIARRTEPTQQSPPADDISTSIASTSAEEEAQRLSAEQQVEAFEHDKDDVAVESDAPAPSAPTHR
jgi:hypothetical protein